MPIDRKLHQIWIGHSEMGERERGWCDHMQSMNHGWEYRLHGNEALERYSSDPYLKVMRSRNESLAFVADRLRVLILRDQGGVYVDVDAMPLRPLDDLPIWDRPDLDFVAGLRSTQRKDVALHRGGCPIVDNTFLASAKNGRMANILCSLWTPSAMTGQGGVINGYRIGIAILENCDHNTVLLNHRFIYCESVYPESLLLHDTVNLASWVDPIRRRK